MRWHFQAELIIEKLREEGRLASIEKERVYNELVCLPTQVY